MDQSNKYSDLLQAFQQLVEVVEKLRGPDGCPWDKEQTQKSLTPYVLEEAYELVEAIDTCDQSLIQEELGDYLFQVILQAQVAQDENLFDLKAVIDGLVQKMVHRHPHVFSDIGKRNIQEVWKNWEVLKKAEKEKRTGSTKEEKIFSYPKNLPALAAAHKIGGKTNRLRFDWENATQVLAKVKEEISEVEQELGQKNISQQRVSDEIGDVLFSVAQLARHLNLDPEASLREANRRFERRFSEVIKLSGLSLEDFTQLSEDRKEDLWKAVKAKEI